MSPRINSSHSRSKCHKKLSQNDKIAKTRHLSFSLLSLFLNSLKENFNFSDLSEKHKDNSDTSFANGKTEDPDKTVHITGDSVLDADKAAITESDFLTKTTSAPGTSSKYIDILPTQMVEKVRKEISSKSRELFAECQVEVKKFLSEAPFKDFRMSMYFHRYLQWKYLERQPVTYKTFRMYRVLGKIYIHIIGY